MFWKLENSADDQICTIEFLNFLQPDMICNELVTKIFNEKKKCAESRLEPVPFLASSIHAIRVCRLNQLSYHQPPFLHNYPESININQNFLPDSKCIFT